MTDQPAIREADTAQSAAASEGAPPPSGEKATPTESGVEAVDTTATRPESSAPSETHSASGKGHSDDRDEDGEEERKASAQEFAEEHDPAKHDVAAGEESRQRGDWTADEAGGPQVWDAEGNLVGGTSPAQPPASPDQTDDDAETSQADRRTSSLEEVRDGGYSVGSAAPFDDGAVPLGHPVKAWEDTKTFAVPDHPSYLDAEPDLWFTDDGAAQRAGFRPAD